MTAYDVIALTGVFICMAEPQCGVCMWLCVLTAPQCVSWGWLRSSVCTRAADTANAGGNKLGGRWREKTWLLLRDSF